MSSQRRNLWSGNSKPNTAQDNSDKPEGEPYPSLPSGGLAQGSLIDSLRVAVPKKRDRSWEKKNPSITYRGIPPKLHAALKDIAEDLQVNVDDVARAFLEFGLQCHRFGEIHLNPHPKGQRMTLFPKSGSKKPGWMQRISDEGQSTKSPKSKRRRDKNEKIWQNRASYRLPRELHNSIKQIAEKHHLPIGELATLLIGHAFEAYQQERLVLSPQPRMHNRLTISQDNEE